MYTIYFFNLTTGEVVFCHRKETHASAAARNFRSRMRRYGILSSGDSYKLIMYTGERSLDTPPEGFDYEAIPVRVAR